MFNRMISIIKWQIVSYVNNNKNYRKSNNNIMISKICIFVVTIE